jgi:hypothetical protein
MWDLIALIGWDAIMFIGWIVLFLILGAALLWPVKDRC